MKRTGVISFYFFLLIILSACTCDAPIDNNQLAKYTPKNIALYNEIAKMDSLFFHAYNNCDLKTQSNIYADNIEFYHDRDGLITSKQEIMKGTQDNICGKVTRELIKGSIEVYEIKNYGAIEIGLHKFNSQKENKNSQSNPSKYIITWKKDDEKWKITRVVSLH